MVSKSFLVRVALVLSPLSVAAGLAQDVRLEPVAQSLSSPIGLRDPGDGSGRLFLFERGGDVLILENGTVSATPFLELGDVDESGEGGLLGLAFHPDFANNGHVFVHYTRSDMVDCASPFFESVVARFVVSSGNPDLVDPGEREDLLEVCQPATNHNGGDLAFGPDGHLYVSFGDGGGSNDSFDHGQNLDTPLGAILRLDVDPLPATAPPDNPFVGVPGDDRIWVYGLRNPYRVSFDRLTGDLLIGDVGQGAREEVDRVPFGSGGGQNFGWPCREGFVAGPDSCTGAFVDPVLDYGHTNGNGSITGGYRYLNAGPLSGRYLFGDFSSGRIWAAIPGPVPWSFSTLDEQLSGFSLVGFGQDAEGNVYVASFDGNVYRILGQSEIFSSGFESGGTSFWSSAVTP